MESTMNTGSHTPGSAPGEGRTEAQEVIVNTLVSMYATTNTEERNQLYAKLCQIAEDKVHFIKTILSILSTDYTVQERLSVTLFFKSYLNNLIIKKQLQADERSGLFEELVKIMFEFDIPNQVLNNLSPCLESILFFDESDNLNSQHLVENLFAMMMHYMEPGVENVDIRVIRVFFSIYKVATNVIQDVETLSGKMKEYNDVLSDSADRLVN